jgi:hypothetical protein
MFIKFISLVDKNFTIKNPIHMKKSILTITVFVFTLISSLEINAQDFKKLDKSPMDMAAFPSSYKISDKIVKVIYSRPQLKRKGSCKISTA